MFTGNFVHVYWKKKCFVAHCPERLVMCATAASARLGPPQVYLHSCSDRAVLLRCCHEAVTWHPASRAEPPPACLPCHHIDGFGQLLATDAGCGLGYNRRSLLVPSRRFVRGHLQCAVHRVVQCLENMSQLRLVVSASSPHIVVAFAVP